LNVILVTRDTALGRFLAASLYGVGKLDRIVIETGGPSWRYYWRKLKRVGPVDAVFQFYLNRWFRAQAGKHVPTLPLPPHETVRNINAYRFGSDDLVLGFGTSYVTARTLERLPRGFLNLHTGWLPQYRGVKSEFWVLHNADHARAGWTLHYMKPELDAGDMVLRQAIEPEDADPARLRSRLLADAVPALAGFIDTVRSSGFAAIPRTPQQDGRYYSTPTWREWRAYRARVRRTPARR
jgi:hypothetical protein